MKIFFRIATILLFFSVLATLIAYARGYRLDFEKQTLNSTGILAISSSPKAAKVYINNELKGVTDLNLNLPPGNYNIDIKKDGYTSLVKQINLKGELVVTVDALLFPINPTLSPLTNLGIVKSFPLDQTDKILVFSQTGDELKDGVYLFEAAKRPLSFFPPLKTIALKTQLSSELDFKNADVHFSPDFKQAIVEFSQENKSFLISLEEENKTPFDVTTSKNTLLEAWDKVKVSQNNKIMELFPQSITKIASDSFHIISFSHDETKILYVAQKKISLPLLIKPPLIAANQTLEERDLITGGLYVYDKKEDKNFKINSEFIIQNSELKTKNLKLKINNYPQWYPDSKHLTFIDDKKISFVDYDGTNKQAVYSGPFDNTFLSITSDGKLVILSNFNPENNPLPDLYLVGL